ncbi:MAG: pyridoxamine 5-phosphate oxidase [Pseudomonadota bacterium]
MTSTDNADDDCISDWSALEAAVGRRSPAINHKVIDHLDSLALEWLRASALGFATFATGTEQSLALIDATAVSAAESQIQLPGSAIEQNTPPSDLGSFGSLWLIPGVRETLRINGRYAREADGTVIVNVHECYAHCAKALIRSGFWEAQANDNGCSGFDTLLGDARFLVLATVGGDLNADVSPKGDPAGLLIQRDGDDLLFAERPGNRRTDSLRNLIERNTLTALLLQPGQSTVGTIRGEVSLSTSQVLRSRFAVQGKQPSLVARIQNPSVDLYASTLLERASPWRDAPVSAPKHIDPAKVFATHVQLHKAKGLGAAVGRTLLKIPGLMQRGLDRDYENNLY